MPGADQAAVASVRAEVLAAGAEFRSVVSRALGDAFRRRLDALEHARADEIGPMAPGVGDAFRAAVRRAIDLSVAEVDRRLADEGIWLEPLTAPGVVPLDAEAWEVDLPDWLVAILRRFRRRDAGPRLGELDDPGNRIWVALLSAAKPLDAVLQEFGLVPSPTPDLGGGHFGLAPRTAAQLDPTGTLHRIWKRYRSAYERYRLLTAGRRRSA